MCFRKKPAISIIIPFRDDGEHRSRVLHWLKRYWAYHLPEAEIVIGEDDGTPFSKAAAINEAASRACGRVFVIADADACIDAHHVRECAARILRARKHHHRLWFIPYTHLYRLTEEITLELLETNPHDPLPIPTPPPCGWVEPGDTAQYGHRFGALMSIMPREAFFIAGGFDVRFRGWGSEDAAFMRAVDTLYAPHELAHNAIFHLWHERIGNSVATRKWVGQVTGTPNGRLAQRYGAATGEPGFMRQLVDEHVSPKPRYCCRFRHWWMGEL